MPHVPHERYWKKLLVPGETLLHAFGISRVYIFFFYIFPAVIIMALAIFLPFLPLIARLLFLLAGASLFIPVLFLAFFVHYAITTRRVMRRVGVLAKGFTGINFAYITDISIREPVLEHLITRTGTIDINTAGSPGVELQFMHVGRPFDIRRDIHKHRNDIMVAEKPLPGGTNPVPHPHTEPDPLDGTTK